MCFSSAFLRLLRSTSLVASAALLLVGCGGGAPMIDNGADQTARIPPSKPAKSAFTTTHPHQFPVHGVDVSKYQGDIDWQQVKAGGTRFAYIKATEGADHVDQKFYQNWDGARAAGVARGAYHFVFWCRSPAQEMANFKRIVPVERDALPPVLDVEATPTSQTCKRRIVREDAIREMRAMLHEMERHYGKKPVIYTTVDFYEAVLNPNELSEYPIWVRSTKHSPHVRYGERKWAFWQYQSDGRVPGIRGNVDRNAFHGSPQQWMAFTGESTGAGQQFAQQAPMVEPEAVAALPPLAASGLKAIPGAVAAPAPAVLMAPVPVARSAVARSAALHPMSAPAKRPARGLPPMQDDDAGED